MGKIHNSSLLLGSSSVALVLHYNMAWHTLQSSSLFVFITLLCFKKSKFCLGELIVYCTLLYEIIKYNRFSLELTNSLFHFYTLENEGINYNRNPKLIINKYDTFYFS